MVKNIIVGIFICFLCKSLYSQDLNVSPIRIKKWVNNDTLLLDSCSINPKTLQILDLKETTMRVIIDLMQDLKNYFF